MSIVITKERSDTPYLMMLIQELEGELEGFYPTESRHGYSVEKLIQLNVAFFVTHKDGVLAGCGECNSSEKNMVKSNACTSVQNFVNLDWQN
jgi:hypothetical protein